MTSAVLPLMAAERRSSSRTLPPVTASRAAAEWPEVDCEPLWTVFAASPAAADHGAEPTANAGRAEDTRRGGGGGDD